MRLRGIVSLFILVVSLILVWVFFVDKTYLWDLQENEKHRLQRKELPRSDCDPPVLFQSHPGCCPQKVCAVDHYPFFIRSGVANVVGPKICFNNSIIMGGIMNNIGQGLNIVVVKGETGEILKSNYFNAHTGELLEFLKSIQAGNIVCVASYEDPAEVLTDEIREIFIRLGSTMSRSVKRRDTWVFVGAEGIIKESPFEKLSANDEKSNVYGGWPEMREVGGCFPRKI
ncbi:protein FAM3D [Astyanax mexicanus]|uniref:protein FAM3D n=1 Tax=Astyanax mexicanus TaxID=7994 RepID=UPI0020CB059F|nr:protein FAM3D [Astyanax mexicanus]